MARLNQKLKASTLVESLIAMVIIVVFFGVATMIYTNVLNSDKQRLQLKAILLLNQQAILIKSEKKFIDGQETVGEWTIKRVIEHYEQSENLYKLTLSIIDKNEQLITQRNELIIVE